MHTIERELIKAAGYKAQRKFADRQDYLKSLLNAVSKLEDDEFDTVSDGAADWVNAAVEAVNTRDDIPDFDEKVAAEDDAEDEESAVADSDDSEDGADDDETDDDSSDDDDEPADDPDDEPAVDEEPEEKPAKKPKKSAKPVKEAVEKKKPVKGQRPPQFDKGDVVLDKWGAMDGSKNSQALAMFEKGATSKEVKDALGGTYYNILKKAVENGHKLEKEGAMVKLTHSSDLNKKPVKKAGKK